jgi:hypothetical protein
MRASVDKSMKPLRACLANMTTTAFQVTVTKVGPRTPETTRDRPIYRVPEASVKVAQVLTVGDRASDDESLKAANCVTKEANKVKLPAPKERDSWYMMSFLVVAP